MIQNVLHGKVILQGGLWRVFYCVNFAKTRAFSDLYFPIYGQNLICTFSHMDRLGILSKYGKIRIPFCPIFKSVNFGEAEIFQICQNIWKSVMSIFWGFVKTQIQDFLNCRKFDDFLLWYKVTNVKDNRLSLTCLLCSFVHIVFFIYIKWLQIKMQGHQFQLMSINLINILRDKKKY